MRISFFLLCVLLSYADQLYSQHIGTWKNYTNMQHVNEARLTQSGLWAATTGGAFNLNTADNSFTTLNISNSGKQLSSLTQLTSVSVATNGNIWFGNLDGYIDIYNPSSGNFEKRIIDIYNSSQSQKKITSITFKGDTAVISTQFGISLVDADSFYFLDSFGKFGSFQNGASVSSVIVSPQFFVATNNGIAMLKSFKHNPTDPDSWLTFTTSEGLPSATVNKLVYFNGSVVAATSLGISVYNNSVWQNFIPELNRVNVTDMYVYNSSLLLLAGNELYTYENGVLTHTFTPSGTTVNGIAGRTDSEIFLATESGILVYSGDPSAVRYMAPDGPSSNSFRGLAVDRDGILWSGSGTQAPAATGFFKFDNTGWINFSHSDIDRSLYDGYFKVYAAPDNAKYIMSWGEGFVRYRNNKFDHFSYYNTPLVGISTSPQFIVMAGAAADSKGRIWLLNYAASDKTVISMLDMNDSLHLFQDQISNSIKQGYEILVDDNDTKWMVVSKEGASHGEELYYYNENKKLYKDDINGWGRINRATGLNSEVINTLVLDRRGELWVGGSNGINIIPNVDVPRSGIKEISVLNNQNVSSIAVDALNQKWIGTAQGAFLFSADGTKLLNHINTDNSPLPNNNILSVAINHNTGTVYFGTEQGLASYTTTAVNPMESFDEVSVSPNPLILGSNDNPNVLIDGLVRDSNIKIFTISGKLVSEFASDGGRVAVWNGKDSEGRTVASGVYMIVAYDAEGNNVATAKLAVIRK